MNYLTSQDTNNAFGGHLCYSKPQGNSRMDNNVQKL